MSSYFVILRFHPEYHQTGHQVVPLIDGGTPTNPQLLVDVGSLEVLLQATPSSETTHTFWEFVGGPMKDAELAASSALPATISAEGCWYARRRAALAHVIEKASAGSSDGGFQLTETHYLPQFVFEDHFSPPVQISPPMVIPLELLNSLETPHSVHTARSNDADRSLFALFLGSTCWSPAPQSFAKRALNMDAGHHGYAWVPLRAVCEARQHDAIPIQSWVTDYFATTLFPSLGQFLGEKHNIMLIKEKEESQIFQSINPLSSSSSSSSSPQFLIQVCNSFLGNDHQLLSPNILFASARCDPLLPKSIKRLDPNIKPGIEAMFNNTDPQTWLPLKTGTTAVLDLRTSEPRSVDLLFLACIPSSPLDPQPVADHFRAVLLQCFEKTPSSTPSLAIACPFWTPTSQCNVIPLLIQVLFDISLQVPNTSSGQNLPQFYLVAFDEQIRTDLEQCLNQLKASIATPDHENTNVKSPTKTVVEPSTQPSIELSTPSSSQHQSPDSVANPAPNSVLTKKNILAMIEIQEQRLRGLQNISQQRHQRQVLGEEWQNAVDFPKTEITPLFRTLAPNSPEWAQEMEYVPDTLKPRVRTIIEVDIFTRTNRFDRALDAEAQKPLKSRADEELGPWRGDLFTFTPDRNHAVAIALQGFDQSTDIYANYCEGIFTTRSFEGSYQALNSKENQSHSSGCVIKLDGRSTDHDLYLSEDIIVFSSPKLLLPKVIFDLASSNDQPPERSVMSLEISPEQIQQCKNEQFQLWQQSLSMFATQLGSYKEALTATRSSKIAAKIKRSVEIETSQFDANLPIYASKSDILKLLNQSSVSILLLQSNTGSGKSTQLPQYLLDNLPWPTDEKRKICVLEPRRNNVKSLAARVAHERNSKTGEEVGYRMGGGDILASDQTRIEFMTYGYFNQICVSDPAAIIQKFCAIIIDEAHERSVDIDLALAVIHSLLAHLPAPVSPFKVIVPSATIDPQKFQDYFSDCRSSASVSICEPAGQSFPVITHHEDLFAYLQEDDTESRSSSDFSPVNMAALRSSFAIARAQQLLQSTKNGNILVFLPGSGHINRALKELRELHMVETSEKGFETRSFQYRMNDRTIRVFPFHGTLPAPELDAALSPGDDRRIIFCTNLAETGLTIPDIRFVIDAGYERRVHWLYSANLDVMRTTAITRSAMTQRMGRAGRVASGLCLRLYSQSTAEKFKDQPDPAIESGDLLGTVLKVISHQSDPSRRPLKFMTPIPEQANDVACQSLHRLGAIEENHRVLTALGGSVLSVGLDFYSALFLLNCVDRGIPDEGIRLACALSSGPHLIKSFLPHRRSSRPSSADRSDHLFLLTKLDDFLHPATDREKWCGDHAADPIALRALVQLIDSVKRNLTVANIRMDKPQGVNRVESLKAALISTYFQQLALARSSNPSELFTWLLEPSRFSPVRSELNEIFQKTSPSQSSSSAFSAYVSPQDDHGVCLQLSDHSVIWSSLPKLPQEEPSLFLFSGIILTDSCIYPMIDCLCLVSLNDVHKYAPRWFAEANLPALVSRYRTTTLRIPLTVNQRSFLLANRGRVMHQIQSPSDGLLSLRYDRDQKELVIVGPQHAADLKAKFVSLLNNCSQSIDFSLDSPSIAAHLNENISKIHMQLLAILQQHIRPSAIIPPTFRVINDRLARLTIAGEAIKLTDQLKAVIHHHLNGDQQPLTTNDVNVNVTPQSKEKKKGIMGVIGDVIKVGAGMVQIVDITKNVVTSAQGVFKGFAQPPNVAPS